MRVVAVANQKGGCGKTTCVINLGACLAREGRRVLAVDLDPQGHCALGLAVPEEQIEQSISNVLRSVGGDGPEVDISRIAWQISSNLDLIPAKFDLSELEQRFAGFDGRERLLRRALEQVKDKYDFVLVDSPPTVGFLTENALNAADDVVVPVDTGYFSLQGLSRQLQTIRKLRTVSDRSMSVRILANLYDVRTKLGREILAELRKRHGDAMMKTFINFNTKLKESASLGQPITEYDPSSSGCRDFVRLARELIAIADGAAAPMHAPRPAISAGLLEQRPAIPAGLLEQADALAADANRLLATSQTLLGPGRLTPAERSMASPTHEETQRKIDAIYGPRVVENGVEFVVAAPGAQSVRIAGDFNEWQPDRTPMRALGRGAYQVHVPLSAGRYRYRYVIDGRWCQDPANHSFEQNPYGELNSVVQVG